MGSNIYTVYENDGKTLKYEYQTIHVKLHVLKEETGMGWQFELQDVGTLAWFEMTDENDVKRNILQPIFQYTPWKYDSWQRNAQIRPKFGCIDDVLCAQKKYNDATGDNTGRIPYSEMTEPMPLNEGKLYEAAIRPDENGKLKAYKTISGLERAPEDWAKFKIPTSSKGNNTAKSLDDAWNKFKLTDSLN